MKVAGFIDNSSAYLEMKGILHKKRSDFLQKGRLYPYIESQSFSSKDEAINRIVEEILTIAAEEIEKYPAYKEALKKVHKTARSFVETEMASVFEKVNAAVDAIQTKNAFSCLDQK